MQDTQDSNYTTDTEDTKQCVRDLGVEVTGWLSDPGNSAGDLFWDG